MSVESDRLGIRLAGPALAHHDADSANIVSDGVAPGVIALPPRRDESLCRGRPREGGRPACRARSALARLEGKHPRPMAFRQEAADCFDRRQRHGRRLWRGQTNGGCVRLVLVCPCHRKRESVEVGCEPVQKRLEWEAATALSRLERGL
ncbi:hypothetical protein [Accumulibacter sp.]|uniref:hypothetical protein n=1 Tax=Accumulibacter sp. TaxID=2053492 RepID=UPI00345A4345